MQCHTEPCPARCREGSLHPPPLEELGDQGAGAGAAGRPAGHSLSGLGAGCECPRRGHFTRMWRGHECGLPGCGYVICGQHSKFVPIAQVADSSDAVLKAAVAADTMTRLAFQRDPLVPSLGASLDLQVLTLDTKPSHHSARYVSHEHQAPPTPQPGPARRPLPSLFRMFAPADPSR